jgi:hypothetical protein
MYGKYCVEFTYLHSDVNEGQNEHEEHVYQGESLAYLQFLHKQREHHASWTKER